jgi:hypothetical protein
MYTIFVINIILCFLFISITGEDQLKDFFIDENGNVQLNEDFFEFDNYDDDSNNINNNNNNNNNNNVNNNTCNNNTIINKFQYIIINDDNLNENEYVFKIFSNLKLYEHIFTIESIKSIKPIECEKQRKSIKGNIYKL